MIIRTYSTILLDFDQKEEKATIYTIEGRARLYNMQSGSPIDVTTARKISVSPDGTLSAVLEFTRDELNEDLIYVLNTTKEGGVAPIGPGVLDLSQAPEAWAREWTVLSTAVDFPGGKAGFYEEAIQSGHAHPNLGRKGVLYLHPVTQQEPATIARRVTLSGPQPILKMGVSGNRDVNGDWVLVVKVNGEPLGKEKIIAGTQGWQDLAFDLSNYSDQTVLIEIEARANNWHYEYAFFDYITIEEKEVSKISTEEIISLIRACQNSLRKIEEELDSLKTKIDQLEKKIEEFEK